MPEEKQKKDEKKKPYEKPQLKNQGKISRVVTSLGSGGSTPV